MCFFIENSIIYLKKNGGFYMIAQNNGNRQNKNIIVNSLDKLVGIIFVVALIVFFFSKVGLASVFSSTTTTGTVTNYCWQRTINVEKFDTVYRTDYYFPEDDENAKLISEQMVDKYENDKLNDKDKKRTKKHKEYYYSTKDWVLEEKIVTSESDRNPYWGEVDLKEGQRIGEKEEKFVVVIKTDDGAFLDFKIGLIQSQWENINTGDKVEVVYRKGNPFDSEKFIEKIVINNNVVYQKTYA